MYYRDEEQPIHQQTTIPGLQTAVMNAPRWPPPPHPRPPQGLPKRAKILIAVLAALLVIGGLGLLVYSTTNQYSRALGERSSSDLTATVRSRISGQATSTSRQRGTAVALGTANAPIYATATAQSAPTATASATAAQGTATTQAMAALLTKATSGTATLTDPLSDNSLGYTWDVGYTDNNNTGCNFVSSSYQVLEALPGFIRPCFADATSFSNFTYQVSMTMNSNCAGGLIFRGNKGNGKYYLFTVNTNGSYLFEVYNGSSYVTLASGTSAAILGVGQANTVSVIADQGVFDLFVNQTYLAETFDGQLSAGQIGVAAYNTTVPASVNFSNAEVWKI